MPIRPSACAAARQISPGVPPERLASEIAQRDQRDRHRAESPLVQAPDAVYLDSTGLTADEVVERILKLVRNESPMAKNTVSGARHSCLPPGFRPASSIPCLVRSAK